MNHRKLFNTTLLLALVLPFAISAPTAAADAKVGVLDIQTAIASTVEGKQVIADLQKKYQPRQQELQRLQQEIQAIQDQLSKQLTTLSDEEQARLNRDAEEKQKLLKRTAEDAQNDFNQDRDQAINRIGKKMISVITEYAQQNGFTIIIDRVQVPIYYASKDIELTAEIVKRYDAANPMTGAAAPAKPATTHPAAATHP